MTKHKPKCLNEVSAAQSKLKSQHIVILKSFLRGLTSMGYSSSNWLRWFPWRERPSSSWSGESEGAGGGGEWARARDWPGEPIGAFGSRSTRREMVGEVPVRSATAWSCLASVMSTPLIWIDSKNQPRRVSAHQDAPNDNGPHLPLAR